MEKSEQTPFAELPEALVEEMLSESELVGESLYTAFKEIQERKERIRRQLQPSLRKAARKPPWYKDLIFYIRLHSVFHSCSLKFFPIQKMAKTKLLKSL